MHSNSNGFVMRHDYVLEITFRNSTNRTLRDWRVDVELPAPLKRAGMTYVAEVKSRSNDQIAVFRMAADLRGVLRPGDDVKMTIPYAVDDEIYHQHHEILAAGTVQIAAYAEDALVSSESVAISKLENF